MLKLLLQVFFTHHFGRPVSVCVLSRSIDWPHVEQEVDPSPSRASNSELDVAQVLAFKKWSGPDLASGSRSSRAVALRRASFGTTKARSSESSNSICRIEPVWPDVQNPELSHVFGLNTELDKIG